MRRVDVQEWGKLEDRTFREEAVLISSTRYSKQAVDRLAKEDGRGD